MLVPGPNDQVDLVKLQFGIDSVLYEVNSQMSTYIVNSEITQFNDLNIGDSISISTGFKNVIQRSIYWGKISSGTFDPTVFPIVQLWRTGSRINKMGENWEPPKTEEILSAMNKVGYNKININGNTLSKTIEGQMIDLNAIAKGWGVDEILRFLQKIGFENLMEQHDVAIGQVMKPIRVALSGIPFGPGIFDLILLLGKDICQIRLRHTLSEVE